MKKSQAKIVITGAAGFIGSHLIEALLAQGYRRDQLRLVLAPWDNLTNLPGGNWELIRADLRQPDHMAEIVKDASVIYHLAAKIDFDSQNYQDYWEANVATTQHLIHHLNRQQLPKFIFFSSIAVHGLPAVMGRIENWDETHPPTYTNYYGRSKWEAEGVVRTAHRSFGLPYAIIRPASVYGPRDKGATFALYQAIKKGWYVPIGLGNNKLHYVYVTDLVAAAILAQHSSTTAGEYLVGGATPTTLKALTDTIAKTLHKSLPSWYLPRWLALGVSYLTEAVGKILGVSLPLYPYRVRTMTAEYWYSIAKAKKELGYQPIVSLAQGIAKTTAWYREHGWV